MTRIFLRPAHRQTKFEWQVDRNRPNQARRPLSGNVPLDLARLKKLFDLDRVTESSNRLSGLRLFISRMAERAFLQHDGNRRGRLQIALAVSLDNPFII